MYFFFWFVFQSDPRLSSHGSQCVTGKGVRLKVGLGLGVSHDTLASPTELCDANIICESPSLLNSSLMRRPAENKARQAWTSR